MLCSVNALDLKDEKSRYFYESRNFCSSVNRILDASCELSCLGVRFLEQQACVRILAVAFLFFKVLQTFFLNFFHFYMI